MPKQEGMQWCTRSEAYVQKQQPIYKILNPDKNHVKYLQQTNLYSLSYCVRDEAKFLHSSWFAAVCPLRGQNCQFRQWLLGEAFIEENHDHHI